MKKMLSSALRFGGLFMLGIAVLATARPACALAAFPGAEGGGSLSVGGRGGRIIEVTTLADSGQGSLRDAIPSGPRIVVFRVGGTIEEKSLMHILNPYITIAGQTAPGGGIQITGGAGRGRRIASDRDT